MCELLLIIGCGRSGTCWLGQILKGSARIMSIIEDPNIFSMVVNAAIGRRDREEVLDKVVNYYKKKLVEFEGFCYYSDKTHPNIWLAEDLNSRIPNIKFLGMMRNPLSVARSYAQSKDMGEFLKNWQKLPIPNKFLGIMDAGEYLGESLYVRAALRWRSHAQEMYRLKKVLGLKLHLVFYDNLVLDTVREMGRLVNFLDVDVSIPEKVDCTCLKNG